MTLDEVLADPDFQLATLDMFALVEHGMKMLGTYPPLAFDELNEAPRAAALLCHLFAEAERRLDTGSGKYEVATSRGLRYFRLRDASVRINLADPKRFEVAINRNRQSDEWHSGMQQLLPGVPDPRFRLVMYYCPDQFWKVVAEAGYAIYLGRTPVFRQAFDLDLWPGRTGGDLVVFNQGISSRSGIVPFKPAIQNARFATADFGSMQGGSLEWNSLGGIS